MPEPPPPRRGLVVVRAGRSSLHESWRQGARAGEWDLLVSPYQEGVAGGGPVVPGHKWDGLHKLLTADRRWQAYDYIWLPDDDLAISGEAIAAFFDACRARQVALAAPALSEDSHWSFALTLRNRSFAVRATTYVEVMAPCFRQDVLARMLPTFDWSHRGAGWGICVLWAHFLRHRDIYIFDHLTMTHTRPVGALRNAALDRELWTEAGRLMARHGARHLQRTLRGWDAEGRLHEADEGPFLLRYLQGYDYVIEQQPWMLRRIIRDQTERPRVPRRGWRRLAQNLHWPRFRRWRGRGA